MSKGSPSSPGSPSSVAQSAVIIVSPLRSRRQTLPPLLTWLSINEAAEAPTSPPSFAGEDAQNKLIITEPFHDAKIFFVLLLNVHVKFGVAYINSN